MGVLIVYSWYKTETFKIFQTEERAFLHIATEEMWVRDFESMKMSDGPSALHSSAGIWILPLAISYESQNDVPWAAFLLSGKGKSHKVSDPANTEMFHWP